jgi:hypothetical protein
VNADRERLRRFISTTVATLAAVSLSSCGLPGGGSVQRVDDDDVPYRLLDPATPTAGSTTHEPEPGRVPVVFWLVDDLLQPEATGESCAERPEVLVERLLETVSLGPSDDARAAGKSSAIPPESGLDLVGLDNGTAEVDIERETSLSAERLPVAVGQVVLTITSAPTVQSVSLVSDGEPVQVPLPGGVLTTGPVTAADYADLLADWYDAESIGCP